MTLTHPVGWSLQETLDHLDAEHGWSLPEDRRDDAEYVANGAIPSRHFVLAPDADADERGTEPRVPAGNRIINIAETAHDARIIARHHADEIAFIRSIPRGQPNDAPFFWVESTWNGTVTRWGFATSKGEEVIEQRTPDAFDSELGDWLGDPEQTGVDADIEREEAVEAELDEMRLNR